MKNRLLIIVFFATSFFSVEKSAAQTDTTHALNTLHIGIFAPIYLDSVFNAEGKFRYKQGMPKFIMPGVDFINGAQIALDSLKVQSGKNLRVYIFDTKSYKVPVDRLIAMGQLDSLNLIIGSVKDIEYKQLADFALAKSIPFISATYPNDGGITGNPFLIVVNSTLKAHCEAIYSFILQNNGTDKVLLIRKKGLQEDKVAAYFKMINEPDGRPLVNIETINIDSTITASSLAKKLDSTRQTIIVGASLEENFASALTTACYNLQDKYTITLLGMPNWDGFKSLAKKDQYVDFPLYFTSPYYNNKMDDYSRILLNGYTKKHKGKPNDMVFKGFEATYLFTSLLLAYPNNIMSHLNDRNFKIFSDYNFRPVTSKKGSTTPDYFENKHLYFLRILDGTTTKAW